ncbi:MAG: oligoribonuclease [Gammaproteobacteria bacterium]|nr:oligoribonuclease [Gammaproteobacteria bacterium]MYF30608.1 oligoribonuclease [Gammaproteobacteria bacterium]MYK48435.1 oligoribonuclease [Gammaproteobacteria bacterium]
MDNPGVLVWIDMEMTGLDPEVDSILEIASLVTDNNLNIVAEGPVLAIHQDDATLARMDDWNVEHHTASGLVERVRRSPVSVIEAQALTLGFVQRHAQRHSAPLCGNTVWQDRRFLKVYMPILEDWLHYRIVDVSTVKELARRWKPDLADGFRKQNTHRALDDIRESVAELRYYRNAFFAL